MESRDGVTAGTYISKGQITEEAGVFFTTGISLLSTQYPGLFSYIDYEIDEDSRDDTIVAPTNKWGADFQTAMGNFSTEVLHVPATAGKLVFCGFLFVLLPMGAGVGAFGVSAGGPIGSILGIALLVFFSSQGMIPVIAMVTLGVFLVVLGVYTFVMKG
jgi:hypothetical protein